ncbi:MAG: ParB/RepB/Spo0J family partition protein [Bacilli bacterium]|nr:ParB/RepB/Spo0J family partition protein [Bacilli bacterium]
MDNNNYKRRALGKGLEELFNNEQINFDSIEEKILDSSSVDEVVELPIDELRPNPYQPRKVFDEDKLNELAESIKEHGVFQPIIVKKSSIKGYEIIAGERRVKACKIAGLDKIPAIIRDFSEQQMMEIALLENLQRENLNSIEEAMAYRSLLDAMGVTQEELANRLGKSRSHITNMLGLLNLPEEVKDMIIDEKISMSHARVLSKMGNKEDIIALANKIVEENLNVRDLENFSKNEEIEKVHKNKPRTTNNEYQYVQNIMCEKLGTKVKISSNKINISFNNINDLNRILEILNISE